MVQHEGFFNSGTTDYKRKYNDLDFAYMLSLITGGQGYIPGYGEEFLVEWDNSNLVATVKSGAAWVGEPAGWWYINDTDQTINGITLETEGSKRIDRIVLRLNRNTGTLNFSIVLITGQNKEISAGEPEVPEIIRENLNDNHIYDFPLAQIYITNSGANIVDERVPCINSQSKTSEKTEDWTLGLPDMHKFIRVNQSTAVTVTIPTDAVVPFPVNTEIVIVQHGDGTVSFAGESGVTVYSYGGNTTDGKYSGFTLRKIAPDEWYAIGNLVNG